MSNRTFPIPVQTPVANPDSPKSFSQAWLRWFKAVADDLISACIPTNATETKDLKYVVNGNICIATYYTTTPSATALSIKLPYTANLAFKIDSVVYPPNTTTVTIPSGTTFLQFTFICLFK